jgi:hypothetical protein
MAKDGFARRRPIEAMQIRTADAAQHRPQHQLAVRAKLGHVELANLDCPRAAVQYAHPAARHG